MKKAAAKFKYEYAIVFTLSYLGSKLWREKSKSAGGFARFSQALTQQNILHTLEKIVYNMWKGIRYRWDLMSS
jgi:hypothetical protein